MTVENTTWRGDGGVKGIDGEAWILCGGKERKEGEAHHIQTPTPALPSLLLLQTLCAQKMRFLSLQTSSSVAKE